MNAAMPRRFKILAAMNRARERGDVDEFFRLREEHLAELAPLPPGAPARLDALEARLARLDARVKQAPGQMGLFGGGEGKGVPCGQSHISPDKECRIGQAPAAAKRKPPAEAAAPAAAPAGPRPLSKAFVTSPTSAFTAESYEQWTDAMAKRPDLEGEHVRQMLQFLDDADVLVILQDPNNIGFQDKDFVAASNVADRLWHSARRGNADLDQIPTEPGRSVDNMKAINNRLIQYSHKLKSGEWQYLQGVLGVDQHVLGNSYLQRPMINLNGSPYNTSIVISAAQAESRRPLTEMRAKDFTEVIGANLFAVANRSTLVSANAQEMRAQEVRMDKLRELRDSGYFGDVGLLNLRKNNRTLGMHFGISDMIKDDARSDFGKAHSVLFHEAGHQVDRMAGMPPGGTGDRVSRYLTDYARLNRSELFAESFAAYTMAPTAFQHTHPELYGWVDSAFQKARENAQINRHRNTR